MGKWNPFFLIALVILVYYLLFAIGTFWASWIIRGHDLQYLCTLCFLLALSVEFFVSQVGKVFIWLSLQNRILQKVLDDDLEEIKIGAASGTLIFPAVYVGFFLFSALATIMVWQTNNYLEKCIANKHPLLLLGVYSVPYCFCVVSFAALAVLFLIFTMAQYYADVLAEAVNIPVNVSATLNIPRDAPSV